MTWVACEALERPPDVWMRIDPLCGACTLRLADIGRDDAEFPLLIRYYGGRRLVARADWLVAHFRDAMSIDEVIAIEVPSDVSYWRLWLDEVRPVYSEGS